MSFRPSVCIDAVFEGLPAAEAIRIIHDARIGAFEFWCWWEKDLDEINQLRNEYDLEVASCCTKFISLTDPDLRSDYVQGVTESIEAAKKIACPTLISQVGDFRHGIPRAQQHQSIVEGLGEVKPLLESSGITLVIEPLNEKVDHPGYYLIHSDEAFEIIDEVNSDNIKVVFDIYHQQISEGDVITNAVNNISKIGHFHAAGNPGRNELTSGELSYPEIFKAIDRTGYDGFVGLEYWPKADPATGLLEVASWFPETQ